jgi:hypothetical protein
VQVSVIILLDPGLCGTVDKRQVHIFDAAQHCDQTAFQLRPEDPDFLVLILMGLTT